MNVVLFKVCASKTMNCKTWACCVPGAMSHNLQCSHWIFTTTSKGGNCHSHFTANKTGSETLQVEGYETCAQTHMWRVAFRPYFFLWVYWYYPSPWFHFIVMSGIHNFEESWTGFKRSVKKNVCAHIFFFRNFYHIFKMVYDLRRF